MKYIKRNRLTALLLSLNFLAFSFLDGGVSSAEEMFIEETPMAGPVPMYTEADEDEKGVYPVDNDGNVNEDITVVNPDTGVT